MNRVCSIFAQMLDLFPRGEFEAAVQEHKAERHARGFTSWGQFIAMMFCQLGTPSRCAKSAEDWRPARENCGTWACRKRRPARPWLTPTNTAPGSCTKPSSSKLLGKCQALAKGEKRKFRFKNKLLSLDATVIDLCAEVFDWGQVQANQGRGQAASAARSPGLFAVVRSDYRRPDA
jgi:hypothetical protein